MERFGSTSHRGFSVRSIFTFVLVVVITTLLWVIIGGETSHAADPTAAWSGDSIVYNNHTYTKATDFKDATNTIPTGSTVYETPQQTVDGSSSKKVFILYFSPGVDPPTATTVKYVEFDISSSNVTSNPQNARDVTLEKKGTQGEGSSCSVQGIGWIICPVSVFIAQGMDNLFKDVLAPMMAAQPSVLGDPNNSMYIAWNIMRNIANIAFVIVFLIIIYSQLTNFGVSNYGLKKLIPRLIIAAILVNVSFIIAAAAIDVSNILGYSIQTTFTNIRESVFHLTNDNVSGLNSSPWTSVTAAVLAGGGIVGGIYYLSSAGLWVLIPLLIGLISILILVIVVLAARQAIIVILVIIAPLAFVANLLPNTEKWFDKWKDLFFTMLIFFPAFALVFGGSQLAGQIIIQNAHDNIVMLIFGLAVQIAPLVITPLLLKFSGSLLGKITQIANNPSKGILDRSRNYAKSRSELKRLNTVGKDLTGRSRANPLLFGNRMVKSNEFRKRQLEEKTGIAKLNADNRFHETDKYKNLHKKMTGSELDKSFIQNTNDEHIERLKQPGGSLYDRAIKAQSSKENLDASQKRTETIYNQARKNEKFANRIGASALYNSSYNLEDTQSRLEASEGLKTAFYQDQRATPGTRLNAASINLENSKSRAEAAQSNLATYLADERTRPDGGLRTVTMKAEKAKLTQSIAEDRLVAQTENLKSGLINADELTIQQQAIMQEMQTDSVRSMATKRSIVSAQFEVQSNYANTMTGSGPLSEEMQNIAQGVGGINARNRAIADAVKATRQLESAELTNSLELLKADAARANSNSKRYSNDIVEAALQGLPMSYDGLAITPERFKAALAQQADEKNMSLFERVRGSKNISQNFGQAMVNEIIDIYRTNFKVAGGFAQQDDPTLNIDNFANEDDYWHAVQVSRISNLANANATGISSLKFGWVAASLAEQEELKKNIFATLIEAQRDQKANPSNADKRAAASARASLQGAYNTVRLALSNPDTLAGFTDRAEYIREIEAVLARIHGLEPLPHEKPNLQVTPDNFDAVFDSAYAEAAQPHQDANADEDGNPATDTDDNSEPNDNSTN